jgi:hypothetical protein
MDVALSRGGKQTFDIERKKPWHRADLTGIDGRFPVGKAARSAETSCAGESPKVSDL